MQTIYCFVQHYKGRNPSQRYRLEQFEPYLNKLQLNYIYWLGKKTDKWFYSNNTPVIAKAILVGALFLKRVWQVFMFPKGATVLIQRESFPIFNVLFDKIIRWRADKLIYDFDDAVWLTNKTSNTAKITFLKRTNNVAHTISISDVVIAGNSYLANFAKNYARGLIKLIPTTVDLNIYNKELKTKNLPKGRIVIGWIGSFSTNKYLRIVDKSIKRLQELHPFELKVMSNENPTFLKCNYEFIPWSGKVELALLKQMDIGIMPLENNDWERGKCGLKLLLYLASGIPSIASNVGVNKKILEGAGILVDESNTWEQSLTNLAFTGDAYARYSKNAISEAQNYSTEKWLSSFESSLVY